MIPQLLLAIGPVLSGSTGLPGQPAGGDGTLSGVVVNSSRDDAPVGRAEVVLRIKLEGQFVTLAETTADEQGRFVFRNLLVGQHYDYLPGANCDGIHYPGPHVRLVSSQPHARVKLGVCDSVTHPSPLVIRRHEIDVRPEPGGLKVTESILVANPTSTTYVGQAINAHQGAEPVTLRLNIPSDFERTTFHKEFFGRRFALVDGKLVTSIPWTPGEREVKFTYVLSNTEKHRLWERPMDLPCSQVTLRVHTAKPEEVACNLQPVATRRSGDLTEMTFESAGKTLPAGHVIRVELGYLPVPWMAYGRWLAVAALAVLIAGASFAMIGRRHRAKRRSARDSSPPPETPAGPHSSRRARKHRRRRRVA